MTETPKTPWVDRIKQNMALEGKTTAQKGMVFARGAGTAVGIAMAGDALFRGKTSDGEDRSGLARMGQFLVGGGIAAGSLIAGKGR